MYDCILFLLIIFTIEAPPDPQLVVITPVNYTTVNVSWSEVQCFNGGGAVTHYIVQYQSMCGGAVQNVTTSGIYSSECFRSDTKLCVFFPSGSSWS